MSYLRFDNSKIANIVNNYYNIGELKHALPISNGSANIYLIETDCGSKYVLKEFQSGYSKRSIKNEFEITSFLLSNGISTSMFIANNANDFLTIFKRKKITLQRFIDGYTPEQHNLPIYLMDDSARLLGKLHKTLSRYEIKRYEFKKNWDDDKLRAKTKEKFEKLISMAQEKRDNYTEQIISDIQYKIQNIENIKKFDLDRKRITYVNSHGDYSLLQLICKANKIEAVIDFASACNLPAIWEIIRSFSYADSMCRQSIIDTNSLKKYLHNYLSEFPLKHEDIMNITYIYILQLSLSSYGYSEYLKGKGKNPDDLLQFAFWRTTLLRHMIENEHDIIDDLSEWFSKR